MATTGAGSRLGRVVMRALAARGVGAALRERQGLDREREELAGQLAPGPVAWDTSRRSAAPGVQARLAAIDTRRQVVSEALGRAFVEVAGVCPPFAVATRIESMIELVLREPSIGVGPSGARDALAEELDALAWRIADLWAPGFDPDAVAAAFADRSVWSRARPDLGPPKEDERLGWAPIGPDEVLARAATSAAGQAFIALCASATREAAEAKEVAAALEEARGEVSHLAAIVGLGLEERRRVDVLTQRLGAEREEAIAAFELAWLAALRAAEVTPPLAIHGALLAAGAVLRGADDATVRVVRRDGTVGPVTSPCGRALVLAALADVRAACERAFPGLGVLASGGPPAVRAITAAERAAGPYRAAGDEAPAQPSGGAAPPVGGDAQLVALLDGAGARQAVARALEHGATLGAIEPRPGRSGVADRLVARSAPPGDPDSTRAARATWHRAALLAQRRTLVVGCARAELPRTMLHEALVQVHHAVGRVMAVREMTYRAGALTHTAHLVGHDEAVAAVGRLHFVSGVTVGLPPSAWAIAELVVSRLRGGPAGSPAIEALASALRPTSFAHAVLDLTRLSREAAEARRAAGQAAGDVTWVDRFNVFTRGPSETKADEAAEAASRAASDVREVLTIAQDLFFRALEPHPMLVLHVALGDVRDAAQWLQAYAGDRSTHAAVLGIDRLWSLLHAWGARAHEVLGGLEPAASVLERYAAAKLRAREGFTA